MCNRLIAQWTNGYEYRQGIKSLVLEQAESLRTGGTSLTLSKNGWKALDTFGLGDELRPKFLNIKGFVFFTFRLPAHLKTMIRLYH